MRKDAKEFGDELSGDAMDEAELGLIQAAMDESHIGGVSPMQMKKFLDEVKSSASQNHTPTTRPRAMIVTMSDKEDALRRQIDRACNQLARVIYAGDYQKCNAMLVKRFKKNREDMTFPELQRVLRFLQDNHGAEVADDYTADYYEDSSAI